MLPRLLASSVAFVSLAAPLATASPARAQDASFGCKVLLCAAATAPGWAGIPYCVPVMQELFRQLALRRPWPVCSEVRTSGARFAPDAPSPFASTQADGDNGSAATNGLGSELASPQQLCGPAEGTVRRSVYSTVARLNLQSPSFVDPTTASGTWRVHLSIEGH